jgi:hypothetical protein
MGNSDTLLYIMAGFVLLHILAGIIYLAYKMSGPVNTPEEDL